MHSIMCFLLFLTISWIFYERSWSTAGWIKGHNCSKNSKIRESSALTCIFYAFLNFSPQAWITWEIIIFLHDLCYELIDESICKKRIHNKRLVSTLTHTFWLILVIASCFGNEQFYKSSWGIFIFLHVLYCEIIDEIINKNES